MSKIKSENPLNSLNLNIFDSSEEKGLNKFSSDNKISLTLGKDDELNSKENSKNSFNSYLLSGENVLINSLIDHQTKYKNKDFSLLYIINTFNKSHSNEQNDKRKIIVDMPKISKKLFHNSNSKTKSSKALDFQKNLCISKCGGGENANNFICSLYRKQFSNGNISKFSEKPKTSGKNQLYNNKSGNESPNSFSHLFNKGDKFDYLLSNNSDNNSDYSGDITKNDHLGTNESKLGVKIFNSSLLMKKDT